MSTSVYPGYLTWGLVYNSRRHTASQEVFRFDTEKKLDVFQSVFGTMSGYGVRKKRPKYGDGPFPLVVNDVVNAICPTSSGATPEDHDPSKRNCNSVFKRFGVTEDGIDFIYGWFD
jgi:hypothetical protein